MEEEKKAPQKDRVVELMKGLKPIQLEEPSTTSKEFLE